MKTVDLDDITSKMIRLQLESDLNQKLEEFKAFIDEEILLILGQMDPASKILDFMYLGSEWNASDLEETDLLRYWDQTYNFVMGCVKLGGKVLVHCKMGISRSASTVCAFIMKHFGWSLEKTFQFTKEK